MTGGSSCQGGESLPRGTSAIRLALEAAIGPSVEVEAFAGERPLTGGVRGSGWTGASVTVPVSPLGEAASNVTVCFALVHTRVPVSLLGMLTGRHGAARLGGQPLRGRVAVEYLRAGHASWLSLALPVARRMGLGRAVAGTWIALLVLALMLVLAVTVCRLVVRELDSTRATNRNEARTRPRVARLLRRAPAAGWTCALVACMNAVCWSVITPPFQVPDEISHVAYVERLAETGSLPLSNRRDRSPAMQVVLRDLGSTKVRFAPQFRSLASVAQQRKLEHDMAQPLSHVGPGGAGTASSEPPLYYALETVPYELGSGGSLLGRLALMRLLSALMAGVTALFAYLFVREVIPRFRWAWTVGGLAVALFPLLGFISGGVNPDAMLFAVCAALYYCLARGFRRGLTPRLAIVVGVLTAVGFLTKLNFVGFAPGVIAGLIFLSVRAVKRGGHRTKAARLAGGRPAAVAIAIAISPVLVYVIVNLLSNEPTLGIASETAGGTHGSLLHEISYIWQFYLPRLPGMTDYFPGILTTRQFWFDGLVGLYGWADTLFPGWVYDIALIPAGLIVLLSVRELLRRRTALRPRIPELAVYAVPALGVLAVVGAQSYVADALEGFEPFWEPRYLLPMLALWGLLVALAARGAGRRWGPAVGALLVVLLLAHDVVSQLQVIARYYG